MKHLKQGKLVLHEDALYNDLVDAIVAGITDYANYVAKQFGRLIAKKDGGPAGRAAWRKKLKDMVKVIPCEVSNGVARVRVEIDQEALADEVWNTRAHVVVYGSGDRGVLGGEALTTKPSQMTWHDDLSVKRVSQARSVYKLPKGFNHVGNNAVEMTMKRIEKENKALILRFIQPRLLTVLEKRDKYISVDIKTYY